MTAIQLPGQGATITAADDGSGVVVASTQRNSQVAPPVFISRDTVLSMLDTVGVVDPEDPTITSLSISEGLCDGGAVFQLWGTHFGSNTTVQFGDEDATAVVVVGPTLVMGRTPAGSGVVDVTVTVGEKTAVAEDAFTYLAPTVTDVDPEAGGVGGGTEVTITGTNFGPGSSVKFGLVDAANVVVVDSTTITCDAPTGEAGAVDVSVTVGPVTAVAEDAFTYEAPTITDIDPATGDIAGGTDVTITGTNFVDGAAVTFDGVAATDVVVVGPTSITCKTPAGSVGAVDVVVSVATSSATAEDGFTYTDE